MAQYLEFLKGLPASGKSTYAKQKAKEQRHTVIINRDKIREMLKGEYVEFPFGEKTFEEIVTSIEHAALHAALVNNKNVISDNTNFRLSAQDLVEYKLFYPHLKITINEFDTPLEECIERDKNRDRSVGAEIITKMHNKYILK